MIVEPRVGFNASECKVAFIVRLLILLWAGQLILSAAEAAPAEPTASDDPLARIDRLSRLIIEKETDLERLNTVFRMKTTRVSRARQRRMFAYSETTSAMTLTSQIIQMRYRYKLAREKLPKGNLRFDTEDNLPDNAELAQEQVELKNESPAEQKQAANEAAQTGLTGLPFQNGKIRSRLALANKVQLVGQIIGGSGDLIEMNINLINYLKLRHERLTPAHYRQQVYRLCEELDDLIAQRNKAIGEAALSAEDQALIEIEGKMLLDLRSLIVSEFKQFHAATHRFWVYQNCSYILDLMKNSLGSTGNIISLVGNHKRLPRMQGSAGIFSILSGAVVIVTPTVGRATGNISGSAARRLVPNRLRGTEVKTLEQFSSDRQELARMLSRASNSNTDANRYAELLARRAGAFGTAEKFIRQVNQAQLAEKKKARASLIENVTFAGLVGPPRIGNGITQVLAGWRYYTDPPLANKVLAAGATAYASGASINLAETARLNLLFEYRNWRQIKTHTTNKDQFNSRLKLLDEIKAQSR